jgi:hypothetical protein
MAYVMIQTAVEKRLHKRCRFEQKVEVWRQACRLGERRCHPDVCTSLDISHGGMRLETRKPLPLHSVVKLDFQMLAEKPVQVFAKVVWSSQGFSGLRFITSDETCAG